MPTQKKSTKLSAKTDLSVDKDYIKFLKQIQTKLNHAQISAALSVNTQQIQFYWNLGADIIKQQSTKSWGSGFLTQLSQDMRKSGYWVLVTRNLKKVIAVDKDEKKLKKIEKLLSIVDKVDKETAAIIKQIDDAKLHIMKLSGENIDAVKSKDKETIIWKK